jgi:flavin reductase (DIM6/NTAB) family NADH-FMN oxidoreductase RutF
VIIAQQKASPAHAEDLTADLFRLAMRNLAGGVSIITAGRGEARTGLTATSLTSLSVDPPSILVCIRRVSATLAVITADRTFGVSVLSDDQIGLAERFSGRSGVSGAARYFGANWLTLATGAPLLADAMAAVDCSVDRLIDWHSHVVVIGRVRAIRLGYADRPLVYWRGNYERASGIGYALPADHDPDHWY